MHLNKYDITLKTYFSEDRPIEIEGLIPQFSARVECGLFGISEDHIEKYCSLDERFIKNKNSTFLFQASSDSMEPFIYDGDILVVDRSIDGSHNRIAIIALDGGLICKRIIHTSKGVILRSDNKKYKDIIVNAERDDFYLWGIVTTVIKDA